MQFDEIKRYQDVVAYKMKANQMTVLLVPNPVAPVVGCQITYSVGSRNEAIGYTGATHLLEHLMFKGSKNYNKKLGNSIDTLEHLGGYLNATTWNDRTNYYAVVPKQHLATALAMEADRMRGAFIDEEDRQAEMTVVRNEFERGENEAISALHKGIWSTAYKAHPYHHDTIGWLSDIENVPIERLKAFYDEFYWPNNATLSLFGDFDHQQALDQVADIFGHIPASTHQIPGVYTKEPVQEGVRRFEIRRHDQVAWVGIAHKIPASSHQDHLPLQLLDRILGYGRCARLYKALIETGLANKVFVDAHPFIDPGLFVSYAMLNNVDKHDEVEHAIQKVYQDVINQGVTSDELERAKHQLKAEKAFMKDGMHGLMSAVNEGISIGDWAYYLDYNERVQDLVPADLQRVAKTYFQNDSMTVGCFKPKTDEVVA